MEKRIRRFCPPTSAKLFPQLVLFILFLTAGSRVFAQKEGQPFAAVAVDRLNVLYVGIDNPVSIGVTGTTDDKISVSISGGGGSLTKIDGGRYKVRVSTPTDNCIITVAVNGKPASSSQFKVRYLPAPVATVGGHQSGAKVSAQSLAAQEGLMVMLTGVPIELSYQVTGYRLSFVDDNNKAKNIDCIGAAFSQEAKEALTKYIKPGDVVSISNITVQDEGGRTLKIPSVIYNIQ